MVFCFKCHNLPFSGGGMVMWTNTHCFDFFPHVILYILSQYVHNYRPLPHPHLFQLIFLKLYPPMCAKLFIIPNVQQHNTKASNYEY